jgi:hypothetical protein
VYLPKAKTLGMFVFATTSSQALAITFGAAPTLAGMLFDVSRAVTLRLPTANSGGYDVSWMSTFTSVSTATNISLTVSYY